MAEFEVSEIWLTPLGPDGKPTDQHYLFMAPKDRPYIVTMGLEFESEFDIEVPPIEGVTGCFEIADMPLWFLEWLSPEAAEYAWAERLALAAWEDDGGRANC